MEWDLKAPSWDKAEATLQNIETTMEESRSRFGVYRMKGEFSVDLKLGQVGNSGTESPLPVFKMAPPSSKRARAINNAALTVSCLVDGCSSDLSNCRDYHRRHKVCELHSKTPEVTIGGLKQRFCQQCSRFHSLEQFDERKRSCRKRLDGHNRRRRKPQPEPLTQPAGSFLSSYQGTQLVSFSSSTAMVNPSFSSSTAMVNPSSWSGGLVTSCAGGRLQIHNQDQQVLHVVDKQDLFLGPTATGYGEEGKQLAFLQQGDNNPSTATLSNNQTPPLPVASVCQIPLSESCGVRSKMFCDSLTTKDSVKESSCALSLLSSSQTSWSHTPGNGLFNQMVQQQPHSMSLMHPLGLSLHGNSFESMDRVLNGSESDHCSSSMYNMGSEGSQQGNQAQAPQLFPYQWE